MGMLRCCLSARKPRITIQGVTSVPGPRWASSEPELVTIYQGGLAQRLQATSKDIILTAKTLTGATAEPIVVPAGPSK